MMDTLAYYHCAKTNPKYSLKRNNNFCSLTSREIQFQNLALVTLKVLPPFKVSPLNLRHINWILFYGRTG